MSKDNVAQGLTNSPAITSIDASIGCFFASCAQASAPTKIVTPKLAGHVSFGDLKVKEKGEIEGKGDTSTTEKVMFGLTPSALLSRTFLVTPHLPGSWSAKGLSSEAEKAFHGGICKGEYGKGRRNLPPLPFSPGAGLVTPLLGGNFPGSSPGQWHQGRDRILNGFRFSPMIRLNVRNNADEGLVMPHESAIDAHEDLTVFAERKGGREHADLL